MQMVRLSSATVNPAYVYEYQGFAVAAANERTRLLAAALSELPKRERMTIILRVDDWTRDEIGKVFEISSERVRQVELRALNMLRECLQRMGVNSLWEIV